MNTYISFNRTSVLYTMIWFHLSGSSSINFVKDSTGFHANALSLIFIGDDFTTATNFESIWKCNTNLTESQRNMACVPQRDKRDFNLIRDYSCSLVMEVNTILYWREVVTLFQMFIVILQLLHLQISMYCLNAILITLI